MAGVLILGAGVMGSAFAFPLADAGNDVRLVGTHLDVEIIDRLRADGQHPKLGVRLPERVRAYHHHQLGQVLDEDIQLIVLGVSSPGVPWAIEQLRGKLPGRRPILLLTKGLMADASELRIFPELIEAALGVPVGAIAGPCIAQELAVRRDSSVVCAFRDLAPIRLVLELVGAPYYHARPSTDRTGVEVCAALKNLYTLGIGAGLGVLDREGRGENGAATHNLVASLFAQAILEIEHINAHMGGRPETVHGLAGTGDLYVTVQGGRNSRMGRLLGAGLRFGAAIERMAGITIEGAELCRAVGPALRQLVSSRALDAVELPLAAAIVAAICDDEVFVFPWQAMHRTATVYGDMG
jgi:glycerol-3-phosphate dehydrogenase (NAD(P)+)